MSRPRAALNAVLAMLLVAFVGIGIGFALIRFMHGMDPCHAVNTQLLTSPAGDFIARKVEVSCKAPKSAEAALRHQVQVTIAERSPESGRVKQYGTVFICNQVTASQVHIDWKAPHTLAIDFPQSTLKPSDINGQQPRFKQVEINYGELPR